MEILKSKWFERFARKERIKDVSLREAVSRAERGQIDADLGGGVIKQRIARPGQGKSKGYRTVILFRHAERAVFIYGFPKSQRANIGADEVEQFKEAARHVSSLTSKQVAELVARADFVEVKANEQEISE